jgi:hypothetical protein
VQGAKPYKRGLMCIHELFPAKEYLQAKPSHAEVSCAIKN